MEKTEKKKIKKGEDLKSKLVYCLPVSVNSFVSAVLEKKYI